MKCQCPHVGCCPFYSGPETVYPAGDPIYRPLLTFETREVQLGDLVEPGPMGPIPIARALDPERAAMHARMLEGTTCKADSWHWRFAHPALRKPE